MARSLFIGQPVKFNAYGGSIGRIIEVQPALPWRGEHYNVKWQYGKDAYGEPVTAISRGVSPFDLINVPEELYTWVVRHKFNSDEQPPEHLRIFYSK